MAGSEYYHIPWALHKPSDLVENYWVLPHPQLLGRPHKKDGGKFSSIFASKMTKKRGENQLGHSHYSSSCTQGVLKDKAKKLII